jgi:uncharacterized protein DUF3943
MQKETLVGALSLPCRVAGIVLFLAASHARPARAQETRQPRDLAVFWLTSFARFEVPPPAGGAVLSPEALAAAAGSARPPRPAVTPVPNAVTAPRPKHFVAAAGEVVALEVLPWAFDRYALNEDFSRISFDTIRQNFKTGFQYDSDHFRVNQSSHPYHGGLFFDAARSNGYSFWESSLFTLSGSLIWECCMENTAPSINDLVNTTLGGMTRGEVAHRLSVLILDNEASGFNRLWREIAAGIVNPVGAINRLLRGDMTRDGPNPDDRFPAGFSISGDLGYRHIGGGVPHPDHGILSVSALYGDPFKGDIRHPFDSFWLGFDLNTPRGVPFSRIEERGILKGWDLTEPDSAIRHIAGFSQEYEYLNNASQVFGAQIFSAGLLSRYVIRPELFAVTDATVVAFPLAAVQTTDFEDPKTGRNYDFAPGGGLRAEGRLYWRGREVFGAGYGVLWARTVSGNSDTNTLQFFRGVVRVPLAGPLGAGAAYTWYSRKTTYTGFFEARQTQNEWRAFINWVFPYR